MKFPFNFRNGNKEFLALDWKKDTLGEVCQIIMGQSPPGSSYNEIGIGTPFLQGKAEFRDFHPQNIKFTLDPKKIAPLGSVLLSVRAPVGDVNVADKKYCIGRGLASLSMKNGDNHFLFYLLKHFKADLEKEGTGSTFKAINKDIILNFLIPLPPLPEQRAIAHVLRTVQEAREKTEAVIAAMKTLKQAMMKHLFTYGPVPPEDAEKVPLKETGIGMVPEGWGVVKLGDKIEATQYGLSVRGEQKGNYPILRMNNLVDGFIDIGDLQYVNIDETKLNKFKLKKGDILFNRTNSFELVGKTSIFNLDGIYVFASYLVRIIPNHEKMVPEYLNHYLNWGKTQIRLKLLASRGVSQSNINATKLRNIIVLLPSLVIQKQIALILSRIDQKIAAEESRRQALDILFKTLLHDLMTAKIRVNDISVQ